MTDQITTSQASELRVVDGVTLPAAGTYVLDPTHTRIGFVARHLMVTKVRGSFREFEGSITIGEDARRPPHRPPSRPPRSTPAPRTATPPVSGDFLEVEKFPDPSPSPTPGRRPEGHRLHGQGRPDDQGRDPRGHPGRRARRRREGPVGNEKLAVTAKTEIDREDFGITWNVALESGGVLVSKKVTPRDRGAGRASGLIRRRSARRPGVLRHPGRRLSGGLLPPRLVSLDPT